MVYCQHLTRYTVDIGEELYERDVYKRQLPGLSMPCGTDSKGLPIGVQMIGDCFKEKNIIRAAYAFEKTRTYQRPAMACRDTAASAGKGAE